MSAPSSARMLRQISRNLATKPVPVPVTRTLQQRATSKLTMCRPCIVPSSQSAARCFSTSTWAFKGITPGSADPEPSQPEAQQTVTEPTPIGEEEYHERAEQFLEEIMLKMEELQEGRDDVETEYSVRVSTSPTYGSPCFPFPSFSFSFPSFSPFSSFSFLFLKWTCTWISTTNNAAYPNRRASSPSHSLQTAPTS